MMEFAWSNAGAQTLRRRILCAFPIGVWLVRVGYWVTTGLVGRGFRTAMRVIRPIVGEVSAEVVFPDGARFIFPLADDYWNRLVVPGFEYEPEIDRVLQKFRGGKALFVDAGANYGYWSVVASSPSYGAHRAVAIEASADTFARLQDNLRLNAGRFEALHAAVSDEDGRVLGFSAGHHTERHLVEGGAGERVLSVTLDKIVHDRTRDPATIVIVKLDVEGAEQRALAGARELLSTGNALLIYEDHGNEPEHKVTRFIMEQMGLAVAHVLPSGEVVGIREPGELSRIKSNPRTGYNFVAARRGCAAYERLWRASSAPTA